MSTSKKPVRKIKENEYKAYTKYIGRRFQVQGLIEPRMLEIIGFYWCGIKKASYPVFQCQVIGNYFNSRHGDREEMPCEEVIGILSQECEL